MNAAHTSKTTKHPEVQVCHGQNCRDIGGLVLAKDLKQSGIEVQIIACQSLCSYAPTAKINGIAILHATIDKLRQA